MIPSNGLYGMLTKNPRFSQLLLQLVHDRLLAMIVSQIN